MTSRGTTIYISRCQAGGFTVLLNRTVPKKAATIVWWLFVSGFVLSTLAIIIWVLTIMREYRRCVEQAMAVWHLPMVRTGREIEEDGEDAMVIVGIHPVKKVMMLILGQDR